MPFCTVDCQAAGFRYIGDLDGDLRSLFFDPFASDAAQISEMAGLAVVIAVVFVLLLTSKFGSSLLKHIPMLDYMVGLL